MTSDTVTYDRLEPHEYDTDEAGEDRRIHRGDYHGSICYVCLSSCEYVSDSFRLCSLHRSDVLPEKERTVECESREEDTYAPGKSFLYSTDPDFFSFF